MRSVYKLTEMKLIITICLITILIFRTVYAQTSTDGDVVLKVLSFNILHGATTKGDYDLDAIAKVINEANPDLAALQEVDFKTDRAKKYDLITELGWRTKMAPIFGKAMDWESGEYGEGILSKYTFLRFRNIPLPYSPEREPRTAIEIISVLPSGDTIAFVGTHLDYLKDEKDRIAQAEKINEMFASNKYPTILAGDLNAEPGSATIKLLEEKWGASYDKNNFEPTFPSNNPSKKIDYVFFYPKKRWEIIKTEVIQDSIASDHCAYLVILRLLKER